MSLAPRAASVILLDALGTLLALRPPARILSEELAHRFGLDVDHRQAQRALAAEMAFYRAHLQDGRNAVALQGLRRRCAEVLRAALPPSERLARIPVEELTEALLAALRFESFPDAVPALQAARRRTQRLVVVSNWDMSLHDVLERVGLRGLLDGIVTSAEAGARKPSPVVFERALQLAACEPQAAVHVGDSLEEDVVGARAAGIRAVLLVRGDSAPVIPGVDTIATLGALERLDRVSDPAADA